MLLNSSLALPSNYIGVLFHVVLLNVAFFAGAGVARFSRLTGGPARQDHDLPKACPKAGVPESPQYGDSLTLVDHEEDILENKKARSVNERFNRLSQKINCASDPIVMTARTPNILDGLSKFSARGSSTFTFRKRPPIPVFSTPQDELAAPETLGASARGAHEADTASGFETGPLTRTSRSATSTQRSRFAGSASSSSSVKTAPSYARSEINKIVSGLTEIAHLSPTPAAKLAAPDAMGSLPPSVVSRKTSRASSKSSKIRVSSSMVSRNVNAIDLFNGSFERLSKPTEDAKDNEIVMGWDLLELDSPIPYPTHFSTPTPMGRYRSRSIPSVPAIPSRSKVPFVKSASNMLGRLNFKRKAEDAPAVPPVEPALDKPKRSQSRFSKLIDKYASRSLATKKTTEPSSSTAKYSEFVPQADQPLPAHIDSAAQQTIGTALRHVPDKYGRSSKVSKAPELSKSSKGLKAPPMAGAPPKSKKEKHQAPSATRRSTPLSHFLLPPSMINPPRECTPSSRVRLVPMKSKPPVWSPPRKIADLFCSPGDKKVDVRLSSDGFKKPNLFGVGSPDRRKIQKLDERAFFVTSTPRVNHAHYGGFSTSTPRRGSMMRRDTWEDFF